jgi:hypothetical protein
MTVNIALPLADKLPILRSRNVRVHGGPIQRGQMGGVEDRF